MSRYKVVITKTAAKEIRRLDKPTRKKFDKALLSFYESPFILHTEKLVGHPEASYRHRIGNWRILFDLLPKHTIVILHIWPRGKNYRK